MPLDHDQVFVQVDQDGQVEHFQVHWDPDLVALCHLVLSDLVSQEFLAHEAAEAFE